MRRFDCPDRRPRDQSVHIERIEREPTLDDITGVETLSATDDAAFDRLPHSINQSQSLTSILSILNVFF